MNKIHFNYLIKIVMAIMLIGGLAGCSLGGVPVTVTLNGTDEQYSETGDWYVAIGEGTIAFTASSTPEASDIIDIVKFTPGTTESVAFTVPTGATYSVFAFQDTGTDTGSYDTEDQATGSNFDDLVYLEEAQTVTLNFYY